MSANKIISLLEVAINARADLFGERHETALRLFNGFYEGYPNLVVDLYARTLVVHDYADPLDQARVDLEDVQNYLLAQFPWVRAMVLKVRKSRSLGSRRGVIVYGDSPDRRVREHGVWYALDLTMNQDASLFLDTRNLRSWALNHLGSKTVLNTFAYTGSLGVAAMAGGALRVVHTDHQRTFLNLAKTSYAFNGIPIVSADFQVKDFWSLSKHFRQANISFDCVFLDPPFFSTMSRGTVDMAAHSQRVINKVRPLVNHNGYLVVVNNALYLSGAEYMRVLTDLCADGYLTIEDVIPVPADFTGYPQTRQDAPPVDPAPFNHPTKIAVLRVMRKRS